MEADSLQPLDKLRNGLLLVFRVEERRVFKPCGQNLDVAANDVIQVLSVPVADPDKRVDHFTVRITRIEVALVVLHGGDQNRLWDIQVLLVEAPSKGGRPLDQVVDLFQQISIKIDLPVIVGRNLGDLLPNECFAFRGVDEYFFAAQGLNVVASLLQVDGVTQKAVTFGAAASLDVQQLHRHDLVIKQRHQPVNWPDVLEVIVAPLHARWEGQPLHDIDQPRQNLGCRLASCLLVQVDVLNALQFAELDVVDGHTLAAREPDGCLAPVAVSVLRDFFCRALDVFFRVGLLVRQTQHFDCQPPRRGISVDSLIVQMIVLEKLARFLRELVHARGHHMSRHVFQPDF